MSIWICKICWLLICQTISPVRFLDHNFLFTECAALEILQINFLENRVYVTVHGKTYSNDFLFLSRIPFTTVCKPFEKICIHLNDLVTHSLETPTPFKRLGHPFDRNTNLFKRLGHLFAQNTNSFERLGHPFAQNTNSFEQLGHPFAWNSNSFEWLGHTFAQNTNSFKRLGHPSTWNINSFEWLGHAFAGNSDLLDQMYNVIITRGLGVFSLSHFYISCQGSLSLFHKIS